MVPAAETRELVCTYPGGGTALAGVDIRVGAGEVVGLLGPNGSGKSTLFRVLATLLEPAAGSARVFGHDVVSERQAVRRLIGVVFQSPALDRELSGRENLHYHGPLVGVSGRRLRERSAWLLEAVAMADRADEPVKRLSGGLRRRLDIAKGLLGSPRLLLMDEPTTGLDPTARRAIWELLEGLRHEVAAHEGERGDARSESAVRAENGRGLGGVGDDPRLPPRHRSMESGGGGGGGVTVLVTTHLMDEAQRCDRLVMLNEGRVVAEGTPAELVAGLKSDVVTLVPESPQDVEGLARAVRERLGIDDGVTVANEAVRVEWPAGHELVGAVMARQGELGVAIREATVSRPTLEDAFFHLTGRGLED